MFATENYEEEEAFEISPEETEPGKHYIKKFFDRNPHRIRQTVTVEEIVNVIFE